MTDAPAPVGEADIRIRAIEQAKAAQSQLLVIGIVGAVGAGTSWTARVLQRLLERRHSTATIVKARAAIEKAAGSRWTEAQALKKTAPVQAAIALQSIGDDLRLRHDNAFVAAAMIAEIERLFASNKVPQVVICDSLRHPDEARLFRMVYGDGFWLLGTVCELSIRRARLEKKFTDEKGIEPKPEHVCEFIDRDEDDTDHKHGQHVAATFEIADYFVDTSPPLASPDVFETELDGWPVTSDLGRFLDLIRGDRRITRPTDAEQAMYHAYAARLGSACLSRQVGAALIDRNGHLLATGCNEAPRAGGGLYGQGEGDDDERERGRCHRLNGACSNNVERNTIIEDLLDLFREENIPLPLDDKKLDDLKVKLRRSRLGQLMEFSRSVHAEMDAVVSAARKGVSTAGGKLFVTTFPCHNCARHIVAAGIDEVQFIEPFLKSKALKLHADAITQIAEPARVPATVARRRGLPGPHKVLFRPYVGAAPRLYRRAFALDGDIKDGKTGKFIADAKPGLMTLKPLKDGFHELQQQIAQHFEKVIAQSERAPEGSQVALALPPP